MMISCIRYTNRLLAMLSLTASLAIVVSSCNTSDVEIEKPSTGKVTVELALNVSTQQSTTRLSTGTTQQEASSFRGMQDWHLIPFKVSPLPSPPAKPVTTDNTSTLLPGVITSLHNPLEISRTNEKYYLDQNVIDATIGTNAYLCYGRAFRADNTNDFDNGSTVASFDAAANYSGGYSTDQITFSPKQICSANNFSNNANGTALLAYLNGIAQAEVTVSGTTYKWCESNVSGSDSYDSGLGRIFNSLVNYDEDTQTYRQYAGSSVSIKALVTMIYNAVAKLSYSGWQSDLKAKILSKITDGLTFTIGTDPSTSEEKITITSLGSNRDGFPASINLPDGAAAVKWDDSTKAFTSLTTIPEDHVTNNLTMVYPAELWYYANSPIKTSTSSQADNYKDTNPWNTVLGYYDGTSIALDTRSIAINNALHYGVGCIETIVQAKTAPLLDAKGTDISLTHVEGSTTMNNFPLTAVFFTGQYKQNFDFTPISISNSSSEGILYDPRVGYDASTKMGTVKLKQGNVQTVDGADANDKFYTLSLQTHAKTEVKVVLEFQNNSGESFYGENGLIAPDMRFYLVGTVAPPTEKGGSPLPENEQRVVTQDEKTQLVINVESLKHAYNVIPDLNTAKNVLKVVDIGVAPWTPRGNEDHNVYNW